jgi:hypothetical protein
MRGLDAVRRLLLSEAREQPLLLIFEDLHWVDNETQAEQGAGRSPAGIGAHARGREHRREDGRSQQARSRERVHHEFTYPAR